MIFYLIVFLLAALFVWTAFKLNKIEKATDYKWFYSGLALAVLNGIVFLTVVSNRPIGASTTYPYVAALITGITENSYFLKIQESGKWDLLFLTGAFLSGLILSVIRKDFKITLIHSNWEKYKGNSASKRLIWSFIGGFILIFGARMAGGCTSGHIISGGMQLSLSSFVFAAFVFAGLLITGKYFYKKST